MTTDRIWATAYLLLVVAIVSLAVYTRGVDQAWRECIPPIVKESTASNQARTVAANKKDQADLDRIWAELEQLAAERNALRPRLPGGRPPTAADLERLADEYEVASLEYERQLNDLYDSIEAAMEVRRANPTPNFDALCKAKP